MSNYETNKQTTCEYKFRNRIFHIRYCLNTLDTSRIMSSQNMKMYVWLRIQDNCFHMFVTNQFGNSFGNKEVFQKVSNCLDIREIYSQNLEPSKFFQFHKILNFIGGIKISMMFSKSVNIYIANLYLCRRAWIALNVSIF